MHKLLTDTPVGKLSLLKSNNGLYVTSWLDKSKKPTNFISNIECKPFKETTRNYKGKRVAITIPEVSLLYNLGMVYVDNFGKLLSSPFKVEYRHWWKRKVFLIMMQMVMLNAKAIFQKLNKKTLTNCLKQISKVSFQS